MSKDLENVMFFNDGMYRQKSGSGREVTRQLASITVSTKDGWKKVYAVKSLLDELINGGKKDDERVVLHSKSLLSAYQGQQVLGAAASVWSVADGLDGKLMIIGPIVQLTFADKPLQQFSDSIYWHEPHRNH